MATTTTTTTLICSLLLVLSPLCNACCGCKPPTTPYVPTPAVTHCPLNTLKLGVCADVLGLVHAVLGNPPSGTPCCHLLQGLADLEAAVCLCTALKANVLGIHLNVPISLSLILSSCQKTIPSAFKCPY